ncbi:retinal-binding protein-like isoform X1 [Watersipora subatra]|uniref:retinal-binding protein-like isoform X1 n=1 Tax=Watersipora subatra TaxID=2589382 RepID=UPI00355C3E5F
MTLLTDQNANNSLGLTAKQLTLFQQFKDAISDVLKPDYFYHTDAQIVKFCLARKWDLKKAETMFRKACKFRETMRLDHIVEEYKEPEVVDKYLTGGIGCFDLEGCPVRIERFGCLDVKGIFYSCKKVELERKKCYDQEVTVQLLRKQSEKLDKTVDKVTVIMDLDKVGSKQLWKPGLMLYLHLVQMLEDNYPEFVKHLIVVNAPKIFPIFFKICRPLISEDMNKKLRVYGSNYQSELTKVVSEEELPAFLGGKRLGPGGDRFCTDKIKPGGIVPESYYLIDSIETSEFESATISPGCKLALKVPIDRPNCVIRWEFLTLGKDISFGVNLIPENGEKETNLIPVTRVQSHMVPEDGSLTCEKLGTYVIVFDNSYSWTKSKKLQYVVEALVEDEELLDEVSKIMDSNLQL